MRLPTTNDSQQAADVLTDYSLAFMAIPEPCTDVIGAQEKGLAIQGIYPELRSWNPSLVAEAYAYYFGSSQVSAVRNEEFLPSMRELCQRRRKYEGSQERWEFEYRFANIGTRSTALAPHARESHS